MLASLVARSTADAAESEWGNRKSARGLADADIVVRHAGLDS